MAEVLLPIPSYSATTPQILDHRRDPSSFSENGLCACILATESLGMAAVTVAEVVMLLVRRAFRRATASSCRQELRAGRSKSDQVLPRGASPAEAGPSARWLARPTIQEPSVLGCWGDCWRAGRLLDCHRRRFNRHGNDVVAFAAATRPRSPTKAVFGELRPRGGNGLKLCRLGSGGRLATSDGGPALRRGLLSAGNRFDRRAAGR